jgi:hypothetical protein
MKKQAVVEVPLEPYRTIVVPSPCACCGKPVVGTWSHDVSYSAKTWHRTRKFGQPILVDVTSFQGKPIKGTVTISVPYCEEHRSRPKIFARVAIASAGLGALAGLVLSVILWAAGAFDGEEWWIPFSIAAIFVLMGLVGVGLATYFSVGFLITLRHQEYRQYPWGYRGHWGVDISDVSYGKYGGPVEYSVRLGFSNIDTAVRFMEQYPLSVMTKGQPLGAAAPLHR